MQRVTSVLVMSARPIVNQPARSSSTSQVLPSSAARVALWRGLTSQGTQAFEKGHDVRARQLYEEALAEAEEVFGAATNTNNPEAIRLAPLLYCISCNNIVELVRRQSDNETVGIFLYRAFAKLVSIAESPAMALELRARCALHLNVAAGALTRYLEQQGSWAAARAHGRHAENAIAEVQRLEQLALT